MPLQDENFLIQVDKKKIIPHLPKSPGVYLMRDKSGAIVYIGKAKNLKSRVASYFVKSGTADFHENRKVHALLQVIHHIDYVPTESERGALILERKLIFQYQPTFNSMWKDDKSYPLVALTMGEDFPRLFLTRKKQWGKNTVYFGPYPSVHGVRQLLKWVWRKKFFPLRPCKLDIKEGEAWPYEKVKSCLYLHTKECPAPCLGSMASKDYKKIAEKARFFFEGKTNQLLSSLAKEMSKASKAKEYESAALLRDKIQTLEHMNEKVTFREMSTSQLVYRINETRAIMDLKKRLNLKQVPSRIECFDISHFQGVQTVASMVSFLNGRADKTQYRKYIIKSHDQIDDFRSMEEVVFRRYARLKKEGKPFPNLIVIDGGKGQLTFALKALQKVEGVSSEIISLAKKEEEVYVVGNAEAVKMPMDSSALLLLRQIRDEAHRFAITFHRQRRSKMEMIK